MSGQRRISRTSLLAIAVIATILLVGVLFTGTFTIEIDKTSGRIRNAHYLLGRTVSEQIHETPFSQLVERFGLATAEPAVWDAVGVEHVGLLGRSHESYDLGAVSTLIECVDYDFVAAGIPEDVQRKHMADLLKWLRQGDLKQLEQWEKEMYDLREGRRKRGELPWMN